jgi:hypothetical protein
MCCGPEPNVLHPTSRIRSTTSPFCQTWRSIPSQATLRASKERAKTTEGDSRRTVTESGGGQEECGGGGGGGERGRKLPGRHEANAVPKLFCVTGRQNQKTLRRPCQGGCGNEMICIQEDKIGDWATSNSMNERREQNGANANELDED